MAFNYREPPGVRPVCLCACRTPASRDSN